MQSATCCRLAPASLVRVEPIDHIMQEATACRADCLPACKSHEQGEGSCSWTHVSLTNSRHAHMAKADSLALPLSDCALPPVQCIACTTHCRPAMQAAQGPMSLGRIGLVLLEIASFCGHLQKELNAMLSTVVFNLHIRIKYTACLASKAVGIQRPPRCCCQHGLQIVCQLLHCGVVIGHLVGNVNQTALLGHQVGAEYCSPRQPAV